MTAPHDTQRQGRSWTPPQRIAMELPNGGGWFVCDWIDGSLCTDGYYEQELDHRDIVEVAPVQSEGRLRDELEEARRQIRNQAETIGGFQQMTGMESAEGETSRAYFAAHHTGGKD